MFSEKYSTRAVQRNLFYADKILVKDILKLLLRCQLLVKIGFYLERRIFKNENWTKHNT